MGCIINLNNLVTGESPGGVWTQVLNPGNTSIPITGGSNINTDNAISGDYTFRYTVGSSGCIDTADVTLVIFDVADSSEQFTCTANNPINNLPNIFTATNTSSTEYSLAYGSGSLINSGINLTTGNITNATLSIGTYVITVSPIIPGGGGFSGSCLDCSGLYIIRSRGCTNFSIAVVGCTITWSASCSFFGPPPQPIYILQEQVTPTIWVDTPYPSPYTVPQGSSGTFRVKAVTSDCPPQFSNSVTVNCVPTLCDTCDLAFQSMPPQPQRGILRVGNVFSISTPACTVGNYVVDWYKNSVSPSNLVLVSGKGTDPAIQIQHPFLGNAGFPVSAGIYIPVIRYIYLNNIQYSSSPLSGATHSPDLASCLPQLTVLEWNCSNPPTYSYNGPPGVNTTFSMNVNATTTYLVLTFNVNNPNPDKLDVIYNGSVIYTVSSSVTNKFVPITLVPGNVEVTFTITSLVPNNTTSWSFSVVRCCSGLDPCPDLSMIPAPSFPAQINSACNCTIQVNHNPNLLHLCRDCSSFGFFQSLTTGVTCNFTGLSSDTVQCIDGLIAFTKPSNFSRAITFQSNTAYLACKNRIIALAAESPTAVASINGKKALCANDPPPGTSNPSFTLMPNQSTVAYDDGNRRITITLASTNPFQNNCSNCNNNNFNYYDQLYQTYASSAFSSSIDDKLAYTFTSGANFQSLAIQEQLFAATVTCVNNLPCNVVLTKRYKLAYRNFGCPCASWQIFYDVNQNGSYTQLVAEAANWTGTCP